MASQVGKRARKDSVKACVVCCEEVQFYALGVCDHWVCFKCCVRMRVLGKENYCPVCRADLHQVFLTRKIVPYSELSSKGASFGHIDKKHGIRYECKAIEEKVKMLLQHCCHFCQDRPPERSFDQLRNHMRRVHEMYYCELCADHLRKYTHERKVYTRTNLARHRRQGDADDKSYKGHPLCEFCDERFLDDDELHRHLRKNHFWCHFCERDGGQQYYPNYLYLRGHFREEHFLCEEDDCVHEQFTTVFRSKVDLQAHRAVKHANKLTKAQARQARQLDVDLTFAPRPQQDRRMVSSRDFVEVRSNEKRHGEYRGRARENKGQSRREAREVQTAVALSLSNLPNQPSGPPSSSINGTSNPKTKHNKPSRTSEGDLPVQAATYPASSQDGGNTLSSTEDSRKAKAERTQKQTCNTTRVYKTIQSAEEFPSLPVSASKTNPSPPPGFSAAVSQPPGISQQNYKSKPPGLEPSVNPPGLVNGKTNTKENVQPSSDQMTGILPKTRALNHQGRNQALVENIKALLGYSNPKFAEFKALSGKFRQGSISANHYYGECSQLFGSNFSQMFSELVDLLPDPVKQQELLRAHQDAKVTAKQEGKIQVTSNTIRKEAPGVWGTTAQAAVVQSKPASKKSGFVSEQDFPSLPTSSGKKCVRLVYKANKNAVMLKEAWVRGK